MVMRLSERFVELNLVRPGTQAAVRQLDRQPSEPSLHHFQAIDLLFHVVHSVGARPVASQRGAAMARNLASICPGWNLSAVFFSRCLSVFS